MTNLDGLESETPLRDYAKQLGQVYYSKTVPVTMTTTMEHGKLENIQESELVTEGPDAGHWAEPSQKTNYKRKWIEGQHCYPRQQNPKTHEHINKTVVMNRNVKAIKIENNGDFAGSDSSTRDRPIITKYAKTYRKVKGDYWDVVAGLAARKAQRIVQEKALVQGEYV